MKWTGITIAALVLGVFIFREPLKATAFDKLTANMFVEEDQDDFDPGPAVGTTFPGVSATYRGEALTALDQFQGPNGLAFVATRSADWCPYCMKQMIQLQEYKAQYDAAGIGLVAITYDAPDLQQAFIDQHGIEYPLLHDVDAQTFISLGILNEQYEPGNSAYGIPHPGMIVIDPDGQIVGKLFIEAYSVRVSAESALAYAQRALGIAS